MGDILKTAVVSVVLLSMIGCGFVNQTVRKDSKPEIVANDIDRMIRKARPLIEEITGRAYQEDVDFEIVSRHQMRGVIAEESLPLYEKLMEGLDDDLIARAVESDAFQMSMSTFGLYSKNSKNLLVAPENIQFITKMLGGREKDLKDYIFLVVAHEMVHMLDDQCFDFLKIEASIENAEEIKAFASLREGHAVYVTNLIADRLHLSEEATLMQIKSAAGNADSNARMQTQQMYNIYMKGSEFVETVIKEKGYAGIEAAFSSPPKSTRMIMDPKEYLSASHIPTIDCKKLLERATAKFPTDGMVCQTMAIGSMDLGAILIGQGISSEEAEPVSSGCLDGAVFVATKRALKPRSLVAMAVNFIDIATSDKFMELSRKIEQITEIKTNVKLNASYTILKDKNIEFDGVEKLRYLEVEKVTDGVVTIEKSIEGFIESVYISVGCSNMETMVLEKDLMGFISTLKKEAENLLLRRNNNENL